MLDHYVDRKTVLKGLAAGVLLALPGVAATPSKANAATAIGFIFAENEGVSAANSASTNNTAVTALMNKARAENRAVVWGPGAITFSTQIDHSGVLSVGQGQDQTTLYCSTQLGAGVPFITLNDGGGRRWKGQMRDVRVLGPGPPQLGVKTANCDGVLCNDPTNMYSVRVENFDAGVVVSSNEGHCSFHTCNIENNYYGVYFSSLGAARGDYYFEDCSVNGNTFANIGITGNANLDGLTLLRGHYGFAPYGIYQEDSVATDVAMLYNAFFNQAKFEAIGNAAIFSKKWNQASSGGIKSSRIYDPGFSWGDPPGGPGSWQYTIPTLSRDWAVQVGVCSPGFKYWSGTNPFTRNPDAPGVGAVYIHSLNGPLEWDMSQSFDVGPGNRAPDLTVNSGNKQAIKFIPAGDASYAGSSQIPSGASKVQPITTSYAGPIEAMKPVVQMAGTGGLNNVSLYVSDADKTSDPATNQSTFKVRLTSGNNPGSAVPFYWSYA